jgi:hypothetical protein
MLTYAGFTLLMILTPGSSSWIKNFTFFRGARETGSCYVAQAGLELMILLPQPPTCAIMPSFNFICLYIINLYIKISTNFEESSFVFGNVIKSLLRARRQWLVSVTLATQEAEIRRIMVRSQPRNK